MKKNELSKIGEKIVLFSNSKGNVTATVYFEDDNFWLTQKAMSELFDVSVKTINEHLKNVYTSGELKEEATIRNFRIVQKEGERNVEREVAFYNLDAIISIGYRVNSIKATEFRIWATNTLKEFIGPVNEIIKITGKESESITTLEESVKSLEEQWKAETDPTKRIDLRKQLIIATAELAKATGTLTEAEKASNKEKEEAIKFEEKLNKLREEALKVTEELAEKIRELQIKNMEEGREKEMAVETERYKKAKKNAKDLYELESDYGILKEELLKEHNNNLKAIDDRPDAAYRGIFRQAERNKRERT